MPEHVFESEQSVAELFLRTQWQQENCVISTNPTPLKRRVFLIEGANIQHAGRIKVYTFRFLAPLPVY